MEYVESAENIAPVTAAEPEAVKAPAPQAQTAQPQAGEEGEAAPLVFSETAVAVAAPKPAVPMNRNEKIGQLMSVLSASVNEILTIEESREQARQVIIGSAVEDILLSLKHLADTVSVHVSTILKIVDDTREQLGELSQEKRYTDELRS